MLTHESICSELRIAEKKCLCLGIYQPPVSENLVPFFGELTESLSKGSKFYENFIVLGDCNIDVKVVRRELDKLEGFYDLFNLTNLMRNERDRKSTILQGIINLLLIWS